jgi:hypothetical protein
VQLKKTASPVIAAMLTGFTLSSPCPRTVTATDSTELSVQQIDAGLGQKHICSKRKLLLFVSSETLTFYVRNSTDAMNYVFTKPETILKLTP